jgi:hypothetical protein
VVALPRNFLRHFAIFILSVLFHYMSILAFDVFVCASFHMRKEENQLDATE